MTRTLSLDPRILGPGVFRFRVQFELIDGPAIMVAPDVHEVTPRWLERTAIPR